MWLLCGCGMCSVDMSISRVAIPGSYVVLWTNTAGTMLTHHSDTHTPDQSNDRQRSRSPQRRRAQLSADLERLGATVRRLHDILPGVQLRRSLSPVTTPEGHRTQEERRDDTAAPLAACIDKNNMLSTELRQHKKLLALLAEDNSRLRAQVQLLRNDAGMLPEDCRSTLTPKRMPRCGPPRVPPPPEQAIPAGAAVGEAAANVAVPADQQDPHLAAVTAGAPDAAATSAHSQL